MTIIACYLGMAVGSYITLVFMYQDYNVTRGIQKWVDRIVKEGFKEIKNNKIERI